MITTIQLPYRTPPLSENQRLHWAKKSSTVAEVRATAHVLAKANKLPRNVSHAKVRLHYAPLRNGRREGINIIPTQKALVDGLIDYGLTPDDTPQYITDAMPFIHPQSTTGKGQLWLEIEVTE